MGGGNKRNNKKKKGNSGKKNAEKSQSLTKNEGVVVGNGNSPAGSEIDKEEKDILSELRTRTRSLLASMKGVAPDGSPFVSIVELGYTKDHPLAMLHASICHLTERLIDVQRRRCSRPRQDRLHSENNKDSDNGHDEFRNSTFDMGCKIEESKNRDDPKVWDNFMTWLTKCGIDTNKSPVEIKRAENNNSGYGLFATRDIGYNETIMEIPISAMLCPFWKHVLDTQPHGSTTLPPPLFDGTDKSNTPQNIEESIRPLSLVTYLANERWKNERSPYKPYLDTLPVTYSTPLYWSLDQTRQLRYTTHLKRAVTLQALTMWEYLQMRDALDQRHCSCIMVKSEKKGTTVCPDLIPVSDFTYELFRWATATAHTRQNLIPFLLPTLTSGEDDVDTTDTNNESATFPSRVENAYGLIPLWDLLNHEDSERACQSEIALIKKENKEKLVNNEGEDDVNNTQQHHGVLICRTPQPFFSDSLTNKCQTIEEEEEESMKGSTVEEPSRKQSRVCFQKGEEIKMYYGERSNAQLLFNSGFVNCAWSKKEVQSQVELNHIKTDRSSRILAPSEVEKESSTRQQWAMEFNNLNRNDRAVFRVALPPADSDVGLDRVREMLAAEFGFRAYVDQGCNHDGMTCAQIAAEVIESKVKTEVKKSEAARDSGSVVMTDFSVSPLDPCPLDIKRALLLCLADKDELTELLRHKDEYLTPKKSNADENDDKSPLTLREKHVQFVSLVVEMMNSKSKGMEVDLSDSSSVSLVNNGTVEAKRLCLELARSESTTRRAWFESLRSYIKGNTLT